MIWQVLAGIAAGGIVGYWVGSAFGEARGYAIAAQDFCAGWNAVKAERHVRG